MHLDLPTTFLAALAVSLFALLPTKASPQQDPSAKPEPKATVPQPRTEEWGIGREKECIRRAREAKPAKVVFVGEAPTIVEMEAGQAFAGESGELLHKILAAAAISPADCYFAPVMVWRPEPPTQYGKRPPTARELAFNLPYLRAQIDVVAPRAVVALGAQAFEALHGRTPSITQARGRWFDLGGVPLLPTFHPNYLLHTPSASAKRTVWEDFLLLMEKLGLPISEKQRGFFATK